MAGYLFLQAVDEVGMVVGQHARDIGSTAEIVRQSCWRLFGAPGGPRKSGRLKMRYVPSQLRDLGVMAYARAGRRRRVWSPNQGTK